MLSSWAVYAGESAERLSRCQGMSEFRKRLVLIEQGISHRLCPKSVREFWRAVLQRYRAEVRRLLRESVTAAAFAQLVVDAEEILHQKAGLAADVEQMQMA